MFRNKARLKRNLKERIEQDWARMNARVQEPELKHMLNELRVIMLNIVDLL